LRGQSGQVGIGAVITLLLLVAVGAVVVYQITGSASTVVQGGTVTVENVGTGSVDAKSTPSTATVRCSYNFSASVLLTIKVNGEVVENATLTGADNLENNVLSFVKIGTNTLDVSVDNTARITSLYTTLSINTYASGAISNVESTGSTVFNLAMILAIVIVAALIIGVVMSALGRPGPAGRTIAPPV
jgi:hypothetical protein